MYFRPRFPGSVRSRRLSVTAKVPAALVGSGNIGTDLLIKALRSDVIDPVWMVGIDPDSEGLALARDRGVQTTAAGIDGLLPHIEEDEIQIAFDATSAHAHPENAAALQPLGVQMGRSVGQSPSLLQLSPRHSKPLNV